MWGVRVRVTPNPYTIDGSIIHTETPLGRRVKGGRFPLFLI